MNKISKIVVRIIFFGVLISWGSVLSAETLIKDIIPASELIKALQQGGHIIYMRHGPTDHTQKDQNRQDFKNCLEQRNLSEEGRQLVKRIGASFKTLNITFDHVLSSPYCRCKDTAALAFGDYRIVPDLAFSISKDREESQKLGERLYQMMMETQSRRRNNAFVGHTSNLMDGLGIWPKPEGVIVVFKKHHNQLVYKGMIKPDEWFENREHE